jgi:YD repeat-containing protein
MRLRTLTIPAADRSNSIAIPTLAETTLPIFEQTPFGSLCIADSAWDLIYFDRFGRFGSCMSVSSEKLRQLVEGEGKMVRHWLTVTIAEAFESGMSLPHTGDWVIEIFYDGFDRIYQSIDAAGNVTASSFDPAGRVIQINFSGPVGLVKSCRHSE